MLLVNCLPDEQELYAHALGAAGYCPILAGDDAPALQIAAEAQPDVIVSDLNLRRDGDGLPLVRGLRADARTAAILIVALSGHVFDRHRHEALEAGCDVFLPKPCLPSALLAAIEGARRDAQ